MKKHFGLLLLVAVLFFACAKQDTTFNFDGKSIELVELNGTAIDSTTTAVPVIISFDGVKKEINGAAGCNRLFGPYSVIEDSIKFENLGLTRRLCDEVSNDVELKFAAALDSTETYKFQDDKIYFYQGENLLAVFKVK